jgi:uncharacterized membrane protein (UPF0127 family)
MQWLRRIHSLLILSRPFTILLIPLVTLTLLPISYSCTSSSDPQVIIHTAKNTLIHVSVEIANTEEKRQFGLMYRQELPEFHGMLFLFPYEGKLSFWMKNTPLPLDILFINRARTIVGIAQNTIPFSENLLPSQQPAQFVLEVRGGFCQRYGIAIGDQIELPKNLPPFL